jgi:hypothetical protein
MSFPFVLIPLTSPSTKTYFEDSLLLLLRDFPSHLSQGTGKNRQFLSWRIFSAAVVEHVIRGPQSNDDIFPRFPKFVLELYEMLTNCVSRRMRWVWYVAFREVQKCCNTEHIWAGCNWLEGPVVTFCVRDSAASGSVRDEEGIDKCRGYQFLGSNSAPKR